MLRPSYADLIDAVNGEVEPGLSSQLSRAVIRS